jgi:hypothetical protein
MKRLRITKYFAAVVCVLSSISVFAQTETFSDPNVDYSFEVPDPKWKMTVKPSATSPNVEYVFGDRNDGHLEVRKLAASQDTILGDLIREEEDKLRFLPGFVAGKEEVFRGKMSGTVFNFEFVRAGRPMSGRFYFLRSGDKVYVLRFTGFRDKLRTIRNFTDSMGRTFSVK